MADGTGQQDHPGTGATPEKCSEVESLVKGEVIVDCAGQFRPPIFCDPGAFMQKDEYWKYHLLCANMSLKINFVTVKADFSFKSNPFDVAFLYKH